MKAVQNEFLVLYSLASTCNILVSPVDDMSHIRGGPLMICFVGEMYLFSYHKGFLKFILPCEMAFYIFLLISSMPLPRLLMVVPFLLRSISFCTLCMMFVLHDVIEDAEGREKFTAPTQRSKSMLN